MTGLLSRLHYAKVVNLTARPPCGPRPRIRLGAVRGRDPGAARRIDCRANAMSVLA
jgi:hypothetical protein